jgi:hypothetical protein
MKKTLVLILIFGLLILCLVGLTPYISDVENIISNNMDFQHHLIEMF